MKVTHMNRINTLFANTRQKVLSVYFTAGFPNIDDTLSVAKHLEKAGADIVEIGMPFSDPVADGPTIQESNKQALDNGMNLELLFKQLEKLRDNVSIPVILMGYINPVIQYGVERFCQSCEAVGVDGLILPDLPMAEYLTEYHSTFEKHGLKNVFLITPQTSEDRIKTVDDNTDGFIYMVSSASTTGAQSSFGDEQKSYFEKVNGMELKNPALVGFGISNRTTFEQATAYSAGAIVGSAFIKLLSKSDDLENDINTFVKELKG
ncbi:tryptophan synthase subunit alpha [Fulvivirga sp. M361]|uniref:tryptophan synthase subunit alpha n=1 Tax=Fulvivirga sp. M361 TaxID=2594266 RepID=UPI00351AB3FB